MLGAFAASLLTVTPTLPAQAARFFRISGPAATTAIARTANFVRLRFMIQGLARDKFSPTGATEWQDFYLSALTYSATACTCFGVRFATVGRMIHDMS